MSAAGTSARTSRSCARSARSSTSWLRTRRAAREKLITFVTDRPGTRSALCDRREQDQARARLGPARDVRDGPAQDRRLVPREFGLVAAHPLRRVPGPAPRHGVLSGPLLVFGAAGQVGRELMALAAARGADAIGLTRQDVDICDAAAVDAAVAREKPRLVVNCAAYTAVDKAESEPEAAQAANCDAAGAIARAAARHGATGAAPVDGLRVRRQQDRRLHRGRSDLPSGRLRPHQGGGRGGVTRGQSAPRDPAHGLGLRHRTVRTS